MPICVIGAGAGMKQNITMIRMVIAALIKDIVLFLLDKDIPPFVKAARYPISYAGVNSLGLQRRGFSRETINNITDIYRYVFQKGYTISHAVEEIKERYGHTDEGKQVLSFIGSANTGLMKGYTFMKR